MKYVLDHHKSGHPSRMGKKAPSTIHESALDTIMLWTLFFTKISSSIAQDSGLRARCNNTSVTNSWRRWWCWCCGCWWWCWCWHWYWCRGAGSVYGAGASHHHRHCHQHGSGCSSSSDRSGSRHLLVTWNCVYIIVKSESNIVSTWGAIDNMF